MSKMFEIAYAAASNRLCFFTGTGFSKAVTSGGAPSWQGLLEELIKLLPNKRALKKAMFPKDKSSPLSLEEIAQVLSIELANKGFNLHEEVANIISELEVSGDIEEIEKFLSRRSFRAITTNYDKLLESIAGEQDCKAISPGLPIPRSISRAKVYHVHGSIDSPSNMVVTSDDYFRFLSGESYHSRKLSTILHENTVVIMGYSLGDTNLKAIISDYKGFSRNHLISANIFLISRSPVVQQVKDYYSHCYGIRVIDGMEISEFFSQLNRALPEAEDCVEKSLETIQRVVFENRRYKKSYLRLENSFFEIIASLSALGLTISNKKVVEAVGKILLAKTELTHENGAWEQYVHLAKWLIYLASILDINETEITKTFLNAVLRSMENMSRELRLGYSWHAYKAWDKGWESITPSNRALIREFIEEETEYEDALRIVQKKL
ncbi:SIR2 family protein, partial [Vibrio vulnificus]